MLVTTYSEARKTLASVLDRAKSDGAVLIKRADGSLFRLSPEENRMSPFEGIGTDIHLPDGALRQALDDMKENSANRYVNS
jgi:hypothetical protein